MTKKILGTGPEKARIMFVGEAPGATEVKVGKPFQGVSGKVLDSWMDLLGLSRDEVYLTNVVKYKLPKNRNPKADELQEAIPELLEEIRKTQPTIIFTLGVVPLKALVPMLNEPLKKVFGSKVRKFFGNHHITIIPLYHPIGYNRADALTKARTESVLKYMRKVVSRDQ